jgi:hypothetical protein
MEMEEDVEEESDGSIESYGDLDPTQLSDFDLGTAWILAQELKDFTMLIRFDHHARVVKWQNSYKTFLLWLTGKGRLSENRRVRVSFKSRCFQKKIKRL